MTFRKVFVPVTGSRDLLSRVTSINDFPNTKVAHQDTPLINPADAKTGLITWIEGLNRLWQATKH